MSPSPKTNLPYLIPICLVATLGGLLFGYDTGVISGAIEPLTARFGLGDFMKGWTSGCVLIGCAAGVLLVGPLSDRFGRKLAMFLAALMFLASALGTALPNAIAVFILFRFIGGVGIGIASISTPMYIAEITPAHLRGRLVSVNQIAIVGGIAATAFLNYFIAHSHGDPALPANQDWLINTGWRWMFATGLAPAVLFALLLIPIPESPRWLIERRHENRAAEILGKVAGPAFAATECAAIKAALSQEQSERAAFSKLRSSRREEERTGCTTQHGGGREFPPRPRRGEEGRGEGETADDHQTHATPLTPALSPSEGERETSARASGSWRWLVSHKLRRPLLIGIALAVLQQVTGINVFLYFGATIFKTLSAKTGVDAGLLTQIIINGAGVLFTVIAIASVDKWGRRPLMLVGTAGMGVSLVAMGVMAEALADPTEASHWMLAFIILYIACFGLSVGPVTWVILSEIFPTAVRGRALGLATFFLWMADYVVTQTFPVLDAKDSWFVKQFHHAFPFYIYGAFCAVLVLVVWRLVPETKGRTLEQIEQSWRAQEPNPAG